MAVLLLAAVIATLPVGATAAVREPESADDDLRREDDDGCPRPEGVRSLDSGATHL